VTYEGWCEGGGFAYRGETVFRRSTSPEFYPSVFGVVFTALGGADGVFGSETFRIDHRSRQTRPRDSGSPRTGRSGDEFPCDHKHYSRTGNGSGPARLATAGASFRVVRLSGSGTNAGVPGSIVFPTGDVKSSNRADGVCSLIPRLTVPDAIPSSLSSPRPRRRSFFFFFSPCSPRPVWSAPPGISSRRLSALDY
jgi:hypothetical protein